MFIHSSSIGEAQVVPGVCSGQPAATGSDHVSFVVPVLDPVHFKGVLFQMGGDFLGPIPQVQLIRDQALVDDFLPGSAGAFETICFTSSLLSFTSVRMLTVCSKLNSISLMNDSIFHGLLCRQKTPAEGRGLKTKFGSVTLFPPPSRYSSHLQHADTRRAVGLLMDSPAVGPTVLSQSSAGSPQAGDGRRFQPWVCKDAQSCSASAFRRCRRFFSRGGPSGSRRPLSIKTFGSLMHPF